MPDKPSKIFDRPLRNMSGNTTDERALQAINLVKTKRPDLWARFIEHEEKDESYRDIAEDIDALIRAEMNATVLDCVDRSFEIRKQVRREAGLTY